MSQSTSRNARIGAIALAIGYPILIVSERFLGPGAPPAFLGWLVFSFGALCLCQEMGPNRPLNRAGLVMLAAAFCGRMALLLVPTGQVAARAELAFGTTALVAILFWSVALAHRPSMPRTVGVAGSVLSAGTLALILAAHLAVGGIGVLGFSELFTAISQPDADASEAVFNIDVIISVWCLVVAHLLWKTDLNAGEKAA